MPPFLQTLLGGLVLAAVSGATFLAYKHPVAYARFFPVALGVFTAILMLLIVFEVGSVSGFYDATSKVRDLNEISVKTPTKQNRLVPILLSYSVVSGYLTFLSFFPNLFGDGKENDEKTRN